MEHLRAIRLRQVVFGALVGVLVTATAMTVATARELIRLTPVYDPPVLAGQMVPQHCSGGFYARRGDAIVLTFSGHCGTEGQVVPAADGGVLGVIGPSARLSPCPHRDKVCAGSDMGITSLGPDHVPWGHLNEVDMGAGGYRVLAEGTRPLACADVAVGDRVEVDGSLRYREGTVLEKGENDFDGDGTYFPCIVATSIKPIVGDSGGAVFVNGRPAGIAARGFGESLAFTPLAEGLAELGLELCTTPDCGLTPPVRAAGVAGP